MKEKCGIYGIFSINSGTYIDDIIKGMELLQHRGQDGCGIAYTDSYNNLITERGSGLVKDVFTNSIKKLTCDKCIGHVRYSTSSKSKENKSLIKDECQPIYGQSNLGEFYLVHNGNIPNVDGHDTQQIVKFLENLEYNSWDNKLIKLMETIPAAYCILIITKTHLYALRDRFGIRPLCIGKDNNSFCISSESCALHKHQYLCDINPGEIISINNEGIKKIYKYKNAKLSICALEFIYFMKPNSFSDGYYVSDVRYKMGIMLAKNETLKVTNYLIVGVPETGIISAQGYANELKAKYMQIITKNKNMHRTFILPDDNQRTVACSNKFNFDSKKINGSKIIIIDDSLVRGNVMKSIIRKLWDLGAIEIHVRISSPPIISTCQFGIDIPSKHELFIHKKSYIDIINELSVTSIRYFKYKDLDKVLPPCSYKECFGETVIDSMYWVR